MKIFGTIDPSSFPMAWDISNDSWVYGAWVGARSFYKGLLKYGSFDEYHLFVDSRRSEDIIKRNLLTLNIDLDKIKIVNMKELGKYLSKTDYTVFFTCSSDISKLVYLRSKYAKKYFPICGIVFESISYHFKLNQDFFNNFTARVYPFDSIICTSHSVLKVVEQYNRILGTYFLKNFSSEIHYTGRLDLLPFGIDAGSYNISDKLKARRELGIDKNKIVILYFGRFSLYDKADLYPLLVALKEIIRKKGNIILLLAGTDVQHKYGQKLKRVAAEMGLAQNTKFIFRNFLDKKYLLYEAADIFVSPSDNIQESFGITVLEAMAAGLATIVSDWDGHKDTVIHNQTGFRVPSYWLDCNIQDLLPVCPVHPQGPWVLDHLYLAQSLCIDVGKLAEYLSILVRNKALRLRFGRNARNNALNIYDWKILIPAYEKLWVKLYELANAVRIAKKPSWHPGRRYFESFHHYPTRVLDGRIRLTMSKNGLLFLKLKKLPFKIPEELQEVISLPVIYIILLFLFDNKNATIDQLVKYANDISHAELSLAKFHIMWLLKKDLIRLL
ncbi:MAG: glycosyltransferase family 4 protein [Candidatus Omnitrophota bacterium]